jgi:hypothetical protein
MSEQIYDVPAEWSNAAAGPRNSLPAHRETAPPRQTAAGDRDRRRDVE